VTCFTLATVLQATLLATGGESYSEAFGATTETGKPMVVMVGTDWCGPCRQMKQHVLPQLRQRGLLKRVAFAVVNADRDGILARRLTGGGPVPQLVMYRKTSTGWNRRKLVGGQSVDTVEKFINEGLALDAKAKAAPTSADVAPAPEGAEGGTKARPISMP